MPTEIDPAVPPVDLVTAPVVPIVTAPKAPNPLLEGPIEEVPDAWREHARELRRENANLREKAKLVDENAAKAKLEAAVREAIDAQAAKTDEIIKNERAASDKRIVNTEVRAAALALGIQSMDDLKLIDTSKLTVNQETGEVSGVSELLTELKTAKPYLFKEPVVDTTQSRSTPPKDKGKVFDARNATPEELAADAKQRGLKLKVH